MLFQDCPHKIDKVLLRRSWRHYRLKKLLSKVGSKYITLQIDDFSLWFQYRIGWQNHSWNWKEFTSPRKSCKKPDRISFKLAKKYRSSKTIFIIFEKKTSPIFLMKSKLSTAKNCKTSTFSRVFSPKFFLTFFSHEIKVVNS